MKKVETKFNKKIGIKHSENQHYKIDRDMIGLKYPEILYDKIKDDLQNGDIYSSFYDFLSQLEEKLIFLEKEINVTKLNAFYTSRTIYLQKYKVPYDDSQIKEFHNIISWLVIHKSTQLKGIASDKYLGCKYAEMKIGKNLCPQRIGVYNKVEEIDFEKLVKTGNYILKISNGCRDNVYIDKNSSNDYIEEIKKKVTYFFNRDYSIIVPEFFHTYSKKRIVLEKVFYPAEDLYEFKYMIFNHEIKMLILCINRKKKNFMLYYDPEYNSIKKDANFNINILKTFDNGLLAQMKSMALKLSEDFPNFIRIDLYLFQNKIYLSELTFDSNNGIPAFRDIKYFNDGLKNWKRVDY